MRVVLHTNVLVSASLTPFGIPAQIMALVLQGRLQPLFDQRILVEYRDALMRENFAFSFDMVDSLIDFLEHEGETFFAVPSTESFVDEADRKFWEVACSGVAEALITGNDTHFPKDSRIMKPQGFLEFYFRQEQRAQKRREKPA